MADAIKQNKPRYFNKSPKPMSKTATKKISGSPIEKAQVSEPENIICHEFEPDDSVISNILNYSRSLSVQKSQNIDHIEVVLN